MKYLAITQLATHPEANALYRECMEAEKMGPYAQWLADHLDPEQYEVFLSPRQTISVNDTQIPGKRWVLNARPSDGDREAVAGLRIHRRAEGG